jgi:hypothetical protein
MYLKILLIDYFSPDGVLTSYRAFPKYGGTPAVVIDRLADLRGRPFSREDFDVGGARIYNSDKVEIVRSSTQIRSFQIDRDRGEISFTLEHMGVEVGYSRNAEGGMYYFVGPFGSRGTRLFVSDPYDKKTDDDYQRKQFQHSLYWDTQFQSQMVELGLRSSRGTFSFRLGGTFAQHDSSAQFVSASEHEGVLKRVVEDWTLCGGGDRAIKRDLSEKLEWLHLKPNVFGVGANVNQILKDVIGFLKRETKE